MKGFLSNRTVLKVDLSQNRKIYCLQACVCTLFGPEILQAGALKGLSGMCYIGESDSSLVIKLGSSCCSDLNVEREGSYIPPALGEFPWVAVRNQHQIKPP